MPASFRAWRNGNGPSDGGVRLIRLLRSPFWSMLGVLCPVLVIAVKGRLPAVPSWLVPYVNVALAVCVPLTLSWLAAVILHNRKHPKQKVRWSGLYPVEFREEDEGMRWLTFEACRKAYIFFYFALSFALILLFLFPDNRWLPVLLIASMAVLQYSIY